MYAHVRMANKAYAIDHQVTTAECECRAANVATKLTATQLHKCASLEQANLSWVRHIRRCCTWIHTGNCNSII